MCVLLLYWLWVFQSNLVTDNAVMQRIRGQLIVKKTLQRVTVLWTIIVPACFPCWVSMIYSTLTKTNFVFVRLSRRSKRGSTDSWMRGTDHLSSRGQNWRVTSCHYLSRYQAPGPVSCWRLKPARTSGSDSDLSIGNFVSDWLLQRKFFRPSAVCMDLFIRQRSR